jgi:TRAP-type C4-dicarboxylate transport system permease large subunit
MNIGGQILFYGSHATAEHSVTLAVLILGLAIPRRYATRYLFSTRQKTGTQQTHWQSWCEVGVDTVLAIAMAFILQWLIYGAEATWAKAGGLTVVLYLVTMGRRYVLRRFFETWRRRQRGPLTINTARERSETAAGV